MESAPVFDPAWTEVRPAPSYAERLRAALRLKRRTIRELSAILDKSYEYCRKVVVGEVLPSRELNDEISKCVGLDAETMWTLAEQERAYKRFGSLAGISRFMSPPPNTHLLNLWPRLKPEDKQRVQRYAEALIAVREGDDLVKQALQRRRHRR